TTTDIARYQTAGSFCELQAPPSVRNAPFICRLAPAFRGRSISFRQDAGSPFLLRGFDQIFWDHVRSTVLSAEMPLSSTELVEDTVHLGERPEVSAVVA